MTSAEADEPPDQRAFNIDASSPAFVAGVYRGTWSIDRCEWPSVDITVAAAPRPNAPSSFTLRCDFTNFPSEAPTATPWDRSTNAKLDASRRPKGEIVGMVFRYDWEEGRALYAAYDRVALDGHRNWLTEHPRTAWDATRDLTWWVNRISDLLHDDDYEGV